MARYIDDTTSQDYADREAERDNQRSGSSARRLSLAELRGVSRAPFRSRR
jgi:hypothetical protein